MKKRVPYILGGVVLVAAIFQIFLRYEYLKSGDEWYRVDRLTAQSCMLPCKEPKDYRDILGVSAATQPTDNPWATAARSAKSGNQIFLENCESCHGAHGAGGGVGPSLVGERTRKSHAEVVGWIKNPQPPMPRLYPSPLTEQDVEEVASYVSSL